jgi:hypothetical protein
MAQIRRDLHEDVKGVVEGAEAATDWRRFVRNYPWACTAAAVVIGYVVVPRKHRPTTIQIAPAQVAQAVPPEAIETEETKKGKGLLGTVFGLVAPIAFRTAQGYALQFAEQWLAQKVAEQMGQHPDLAAAFGAGSPASPEPQGPRVTPSGAPRF